MRTVLIDTHLALWALGDPGRLTAPELDLLLDPEIDRVVSPASIWEAAIKRESGRLKAPRHLSVIFATQFRMLDIDAALLECAAELPRHHGDPFDRLLIAHAVTDGLELATRDGRFAEYGVTVVP